jgi:hypothetical protein
MIVMKHLLYLHQSVPPMVVAVHRVLRELIGRRLNSGTRRPALSPAGHRALWRVAGIIALAVQIVLVLLVQQLVELSILLMEVWAELAAKHLEISLDRSS